MRVSQKNGTLPGGTENAAGIRYSTVVPEQNMADEQKVADEINVFCILSRLSNTHIINFYDSRNSFFS